MLGRVPPKNSVMFLENSNVYSLPASRGTKRIFAPSASLTSLSIQIIEGTVTFVSAAAKNDEDEKILPDDEEETELVK